MNTTDKQTQGEAAADVPTPIRPDYPKVEGWYWMRSTCGWSVIRVRQLVGMWHGLNPYDGSEHSLEFPNDKYWDHVKEWCGPISPQAERDTIAMTKERDEWKRAYETTNNFLIEERKTSEYYKKRLVETPIAFGEGEV